MILDSGVKHRRKWWQWTCRGCGQSWPCTVTLTHRAARAERRRAHNNCGCAAHPTGEELLDQQAEMTW